MGGAVLVFVDESGRRVADLTSSSSRGVVDRQPAFSNDGAWIAFASNRGRDKPEATSLWVVSARSGGRKARLTRGRNVDRDPVWLPDGGGLIFSSNRAGSFDLFRLEVERGGNGVRTKGPAVRLTRSAEQDLAPAVSADGKRLAFMRVADNGASSLWLMDVGGGVPRQLTRGPTDVTPTFEPGGAFVYFAARAVGREDSDIYRIDVRGNDRRVVIDEPDADQSGPRFSKDGRVLFATAVYRSQSSGRPVLASIVAALLDKNPSWRVLHDPAVVESRVGVAIAPGDLETAKLRANADYGRGLRRALERAIKDFAAEVKERGEGAGESESSSDRP